MERLQLSRLRDDIQGPRMHRLSAVHTADPGFVLQGKCPTLMQRRPGGPHNNGGDLWGSPRLRTRADSLKRRPRLRVSAPDVVTERLRGRYARWDGGRFHGCHVEVRERSPRNGRGHHPRTWAQLGGGENIVSGVQEAISRPTWCEHDPYYE